MAETGGIIHSILSMGPLSDIEMAVDVLAGAEYDLRKKINNALEEEYAEDKHNEAVLSSAEISHLVGIFKVFFDQWGSDPKLTRNNSRTLTFLATVFAGENDYLAEYNKVCYLIRQNLPTAIGEGKDLFKAPPPFKSVIFDD